ncbi:hypothetical protein D3C81_575080 [compost metagenome]
MAQLLFKAGEGALFDDRPAAPARRQVGRARQVGRLAIGAPVRHHAPGHAGGARRLVLVASFQQGGVGDVGLDDAVENVLVQLVHIAERIALLLGGDHAGADAAIQGDGTAEVGFQALVAPAAERQVGAHLERIGGALADEVDGARWITRTGGQAGGTTHHFDSVVDHAVGVGLDVATEGVEHAIDLEIGDVVPARDVVDAFAVGDRHRYAGDLAHHVGQREQAHVVQPLPGHHGHRLRGVAQ